MTEEDLKVIEKNCEHFAGWYGTTLIKELLLMVRQLQKAQDNLVHRNVKENACATSSSNTMTESRAVPK